MGRYFIKFSYIGTQYRGLQRNTIGSITHENPIRDCDSIQGSLEAAFSTVLPKSIITPHVRTSSRTDVGVHALCSAAHVELENKYNVVYRPENILKYVNRYLTKTNHDIRLLDVIPVTHDFHSRYNAKSRTYLYRFMIPKNHDEHRIPILEKSHTLYLKTDVFDAERVKNATQLFMGLKDFTTFSAKSFQFRPIRYVRKLHALTIERSQPLMLFDPLSENFDYWHITCSAPSFLYNQVRRIVAALLGLGTGKITEKDIKVMLQVPGHHNWNTRISVVPPHGLHLVKVEYDQNELDKCTIQTEQACSESEINVAMNES